LLGNILACREIFVCLLNIFL